MVTKTKNIKSFCVSRHSVKAEMLVDKKRLFVFIMELKGNIRRRLVVKIIKEN